MLLELVGGAFRRPVENEMRERVLALVRIRERIEVLFEQSSNITNQLLYRLSHIVWQTKKAQDIVLLELVGGIEPPTC